MLKLSVLMENTAAGGYQAEHGLSFLLESDNACILFDTGQTAALLENGDKMGCDFSRVTHGILSHGHYDHTGGLAKTLERIRKIKNGTDLPFVYAHPDVTCRRRKVTPEGERDIGMPDESRKALAAWPNVILDKCPVNLAESILFLGEIPRRYPDLCALVGESEKDGSFSKDTLPDDSALAVCTDEGLIIVAGCSHSGIINVLEYAKKVTGIPKIRAIYGGLHCKDMDGTTLQKTLSALEAECLEQVYACHCTGTALDSFPGSIRLAAGQSHTILF